MKRNGSALVIAMMLIAAVGGVAFAIGRLLFLETTNAAMYENGSVAYYAAESGMEEAFLRYRFNTNAEVPFGNGIVNNPNRYWRIDNNKVFRTNIDEKKTIVGGGYVGENPFDSLDFDYGNVYWNDADRQQVYDLRMGYLGTDGNPFYGMDGNGDGQLLDGPFAAAAGYGTGNYSYLTIPRDESLKINLSGLDFQGLDNDLDFGLKFFSSTLNNFDYSSAGIANKCRALAEIKFVVKYSNGITKEYKGLLNYARTLSEKKNCATVLGLDYNRLFAADTSSNSENTIPNEYKHFYVEKYRLQELIDTDHGGVLPSTSDEVVLYVKPINYDAAIALTVNYCNNKDLSPTNDCVDKTNVVSGPFSQVQTVGYYGGVAKKLKANIDRQSGTLYDLYDYVVFNSN